MHFNTESFSGTILTRSRDTYYITRCSCSWPLLLLPTTAATPRLPPRRAQRRRHSATTCRTKMMTGMAPHTFMTFVQHLLVVGCLSPFALITQQGIRLDVLKGSKLSSWDVTKQHLYSVDMNFNTESFSGIILTRSRDTYYITRFSCSWPLLLLLTTAATQRLPPHGVFQRRLEVRSQEDLTPLFFCLPADPHPLLAACITRYSDVTLGRLAGDTFACLL